MFEIKSLENVSFGKIFQASKLGFNDYDFYLEITEAELKKLFKSYGYCPSLSLGIYVADKLVGFSFNGINEKENSAYNAGIAVLPGFRGMGLGTNLLSESKKILKDHGLKKYLLECMTDNEDAVIFYKKNGFSLERELDCKSAKTSKIRKLKTSKKTNFYILETNHEILTSLNQYSDSQQSWQYSDFAITNICNQYKYLSAMSENGDLVGLIVFDPTLGAISKLITHKDWRRLGIGTSLTIEAAKRIKTDEITFINTDLKNDGLEAFLKKLKFTPFAKQLEMSCYLR